MATKSSATARIATPRAQTSDRGGHRRWHGCHDRLAAEWTSLKLNNEGLLEHDGAEDEAAARYIERVRLGLPVDPARTIREVCACAAARRIQQLGSEDSDPEDLAYVTRIDVFDFAMEVSPTPRGMRLLSRPA